MGESQEESGEIVTKFQNAGITTSQSKTVSEGKAVWELKNWNDPDNFNLLRKHANCVVQFENEEESLRFYFKQETTRLNVESSTRTDYEGLSLYVSWLGRDSKPKSSVQYGFAIKVTVDCINENLENVEYPHNYKSVPETTLSFEGGAYPPSEMLVLKDFILLAKSWHFRCSNGPTTEFYEKPETLRYGITVQLIKCNEAKALIKTKEKKSEIPIEIPKRKSVELSICRDFDRMYAQEDNYSDLKLESKDGIVINAHKFVLAARSPKLRALIEEEMRKEEFSGKIKLEDLDFKPLNIVLTWMYTGKLDEDEGIQVEHLEDVIVAAETYGLEELQKLCELKVIAICNIMNMLNLFQLAQKYGMLKAMRSISLFIKENIEDVATPTFV